ncbi:MAG TPA: DedA family protein [Clostridiaceae bacterium]
MIGQFFGFILHIDKSLDVVIKNYGTLVYLFFFLVVFCETGLVIIPFLPGDSLVFAASAFAARLSSPLNIWLVFLIFSTAAIIGDTVNYQIGYFFGEKLFSNSNSKLFKRAYLDKTHNFYDKHGSVTIIIARFMPIIRTFAPFVAGIGKMNYFKFLAYNVVGGIGWVAVFCISGYFFGNIPFIQAHFTEVVYFIIFVSLLPAIIAFIKSIVGNRKVA